MDRRLLVLMFCSFWVWRVADGNVVLISNGTTLNFDDIEANFAPAVKGSGKYGLLYLAEPLDACSPLTNTFQQTNNISSAFALIVRGGCSFEDKVRTAQKAGFKAAIVYDNEDGSALVAMAGNSAGIKIHAVFISKSSGEKLKQFADLTNVELWIIPCFENSAWSIMAISFISLLAMSAVLATCFFVRRHHIWRDNTRSTHVREFHGMSSRLVKAMPSLIFTAVLEDNSTSGACAICLEDYIVGEKLRVLPCRHKFHAFCVDSWLTSWRTFCPVCKRDARTSTGDPPASEFTPLLSSLSAPLASSAALSSFRSSLASSTAIQIARVSMRSSMGSHVHSVASTPYVQQSIRSYHHSPISVTPSSMDLRNASSQRSHASHLVSPHSLGYPTTSLFSTRYMSPFIPSSSNASCFLGSCSIQRHPLHYSESAATFSPFSSAHSLPEC